MVLKVKYINPAIKKPSFRPKRSGEPESITHCISWIPAFAGMTWGKTLFVYLIAGLIVKNRLDYLIEVGLDIP
jgi:hypothetical protein